MQIRRSWRFIALVSLIFISCASSEEAASPDNSENTPGDSPTVASIQFDAGESLILEKGTQFNATITVTDTDGLQYLATDVDSILWFSNDTSIASISSDGVITANAKGSTYIKATIYNRSDTIALTVTDTSTEGDVPEDPLPNVVIEPKAPAALKITNKDLSLPLSETRSLTFDVTYADTTTESGLDWNQLNEHVTCTPLINVSNTDVANLLDNAIFDPRAYGVVSTTIHCDDLADTWTVRIIGESTEEPAASPDQIPESDDTPANAPDEQSPDEDPVSTQSDLTREDPETVDDAFLQSDDEITFTPADGASYGHDKMPDVIFGAPVSTRTDVVSFGTGGSMIIHLQNYVLIDDDGADFTIFENPFSGWTERATVSVSSDGSNYFEFPCDAFDAAAVYTGCAGVNEINYSSIADDMLDPNTSGGDTFDLSEIGAPEPIRYIKIVDAETCTSPALCTSSAGFDLDAIAIINGIYE